MELTVLLGDKGYVDFNRPTKMSVEQRQKLVKLFQSIFSPSIIKIKNVDDFRDWRIGDKKLYPRQWIEEEYEVLFGVDSIDEAVEKLGRSWQAVVVKDGHWRYKFISWCKERGKDLIKGNKLEIIKEFVREHEELKQKDRKKKKEIRLALKTLIEDTEKLREKLEKLQRRPDLYSPEAFAEEKEKLKEKYKIINSKKIKLESEIIADTYIEKYHNRLKEIFRELKRIAN